jgi:Right handed beta helix region
MKKFPRSSRSRILLVIGCLVLTVVAIAGCQPSKPSSSARPTPSSTTPRLATTVCGQPMLRSPFTYHGKSGSYLSGTAGLPTFGTAGSNFPRAKSGAVLPLGNHYYPSYELQPDTVYYMLPGTHVGAIQADENDAFVGGYWNGQGAALSGDYSSGGQAIDSNSTIGDQTGVTIEYLMIEKYTPNPDAAAINQEANSDWDIQYNTITLNVPGAGVILGSGNRLRDNCMTLNGQYGFQSTSTSTGFAENALTGGPYGITVSGNEISFNDTCDFSGLLNNEAIGWTNYNPVPIEYRNHKCGKVVGDGNQGGFKLWETNGVTIADNYIHDNWGPGGWADTNNVNTTWLGNVITNNEGEGIIEEISYNFGIIDNYLADNDWIDGLNNPRFPQAAIYISESGSDTTFGGVPACAGGACAGQPAYTQESVIRGNELVNNGGGIFLWQSSNRYCSDGYDAPCTLVDGGRSGPFTNSSCKISMPTASINTSTFIGRITGSPPEDWWDGCRWRTENVAVTGNTIDFNPAKIPHCVPRIWPDCGATGIFSQYTSPSTAAPGWSIPSQLTFFQHNVWSENTYNGPLRLYAWNQGNSANPINWSRWTENPAKGDECSSDNERQSGRCTGPLGQDAGSTYHAAPVSLRSGTMRNTEPFSSCLGLLSLQYDLSWLMIAGSRAAHSSDLLVCSSRNQICALGAVHKV